MKFKVGQKVYVESASPFASGGPAKVVRITKTTVVLDDKLAYRRGSGTCIKYPNYFIQKP